MVAVPLSRTRNASWAAWIAFGLALACLFVAIGVGWSRAQDQAVFRAKIAEVAKAKPGTAEFIKQVNTFIFWNQGKEKNQGYFWFKALGPTPMDVFERGGDCSDKSKLLQAMLHEAGVKSTLVMLTPCRGCRSRHTIVEAQYEGGWMAVDPVYWLVFPKPDVEPGYYSVRELSQDIQKVDERVYMVQLERGPMGDGFYLREGYKDYAFPMTVNWDSSAITRALAPLAGLFSDDKFMVRRPLILEDPKLFIGTAAAALALLFALAGLWLRRKAR
jgi:hypothetical protein